ncbi:RDD family protein [Bacillus mesophilum]|uniref:RDD family protein n=2 Tax=Bacillus mesophilum TaxID=1071718 RepID=A0A7V7RNV2_9BACI|nr:RDD family protein [Bacillus mesophilum]
MTDDKRLDAELEKNEIHAQTDEYPPADESMHSSAMAIQQTGHVRFAGFWMRFWAYLADIVVIGSIDRLLINPLFRLLDLPLYETGLFSMMTIATALTFYLYFVLMTKFFGQTLGKMIFGLKVVQLNGEKLSWNTVLFREWIGRFISGYIIVLYVIVAFLPKKQGLHDLFVDTTVVHEK